VYFEKYMSASYTSKSQATPLFVASIGIMIYLSGTIALYLTTNHFIALNDEYSTRILFLVSAGLLFILSALFVKAFTLVKPVQHAPTIKANKLSAR